MRAEQPSTSHISTAWIIAVNWGRDVNYRASLRPLKSRVIDSHCAAVGVRLGMSIRRIDTLWVVVLKTTYIEATNHPWAASS